MSFQVCSFHTFLKSKRLSQCVYFGIIGGGDFLYGTSYKEGKGVGSSMGHLYR